MRIATIAAFALLSVSSLAAAEPAAPPTPYPAQPTPAPGETPVPVPTPLTEDPPPAPSQNPRSETSLPPEGPTRRAPSGLGDPILSPTAAVSLSLRSVKNHPELAGSAFDLWLGARFHPMTASATPFMAVGAEVSTREYAAREIETGTVGETRSWVEVVPEMRMGWAWISSPTSEYFNQVFPNAEVYAIAGWRIPNREHGHGFRAGVGVSSPILMLAGLACEAPLPTQFELLMDVDSMHSGDRDTIVRFGWHF